MDAEHHARMAQQFLDAGEWRKARHALEAALELSPNRVEWLQGLGMTHEALNEPLAAAAAYQRAIEVGASDTGTILRMTHNLIQADRCRAAIEQLQRLTDQRPSCEEAYAQQILAYAKLGDHDEARVMFDIVMQTDEDNTMAYDYLARSFAMQQRHDVAIRLWEKAAEIEPNHADLLAHLGQAYLRVGRFGRARKLLRKHLRLQPNDVDSMVTLGRLLVAMNRHAEAEETFRIASEMAPGSAAVQLSLGELALMHGHLDGASTRFRRALDLDPGVAGARLGLAMIACDEGRQAEARHLLVTESTCDNHSPGQLLKISALMIRLGLASRAAGLLGSCLNETEQPIFVQRRHRADAYHHRANAMFALNKLEAGIRDARQTVRLDRAHTLAMQNLILAYLNAGKSLHAAVMLRRYRKRRPMTPLVQRLAWRTKWALRGRRLRRWVGCG